MLIDNGLALVASFQFGIGSAWDCHVYALHDGLGVTLIDSGCGADVASLLRELERTWPGAPLKAVVLTHAHADHSCGAAKLQSLTGCDIFAPETSLDAIRSGDEERIGLAASRGSGGYPDTVRLLPGPAAIGYRHDVPFDVGALRFHPIRVRGHSDDSHCLLLQFGGRRCLFAGDALFYGGVLGVINQPDSSMQGYVTDLPRLAGLNVDALLPGHGLFTLKGGQRHIDLAIAESKRGFLPRQIGQLDLIL